MNLKLKTTFLTLSFLFCSLPHMAHAFPLKFFQFKKVTPQVTSPPNQSFLSLFEPPVNSQPKYTVGGAVRSGSCFQHLETKRQMKALVPNARQSLTTKSRPELFAYIPSVEQQTPAMLVVKDTDEDYYYTQNLMIPSGGGILKIDLAEDAPELEIGKEYNWFVQLHCSGSPKIDDPILEAQIQRVSLGNEIASTSEEKTLNFYARNQIWYDSLASAYQSIESENDSTYWQGLIESIGMDELQSESIISYE